MEKKPVMPVKQGAEGSICLCLGLGGVWLIQGASRRSTEPGRVAGWDKDLGKSREGVL